MPKNETALIIRVREDVNKLRADQARTRSMMRSHSKKLSSIGKDFQATFFKYFAAASLVQAVGRAISSLADFEKEMSKVRAVSSASKADMDRLEASALELGRASKFTATEIASLQVALAKLGFTPQKILDSADAVRKLATVADSELAPAAETMAGTLNSFNLSATESERVANVMAESFSKSALDLEKFTVATSNSGAVANALGITLEENTARIAALVDANIDASKAGTDLRKIYSELNKNGLTFNQAMEVIRQSTNKAATAQELFGQRAFGAALILSEQTEKVADLTKELRNSNQELDTMAEVMEDNLSTSFDKFISAVDGAIQKAGFFRDALKALVDFGTYKLGLFFGNPDDLDTFRIEKYTKEGKKLSSQFQDNKGDAEALSATIKQYEASLFLANARMREASKQDGLNKKTKFALRDELVKYGVILSELRNKQVAMNDALEMEAVAAAKAKKELAEIRGVLAAMQNVGDLSDALDISSIGEFQVPNPVNPMPIDAEAMRAGIDQALFGVRVFRHQMMNEMDILARQVSDVLEGTIEASFASLGESIGNGSSLEQGYQAIFKIMADGMAAIGAAMIAQGVALNIANKGLFSGNPALLIGGGVALVAAGAALSSAISKAGSDIGGGGGGTSGGRSNLQADITGRSIKIDGKLDGKFDGKDLVLTYDFNKDLNNRGTA